MVVGWQYSRERSRPLNASNMPSLVALSVTGSLQTDLRRSLVAGAVLRPGVSFCPRRFIYLKSSGDLISEWPVRTAIISRTVEM